MVDVPCSNKGDRGRQIDCCSVAKAKSIAKKRSSRPVTRTSLRWEKKIEVEIEVEEE